MSIHPKWHSLAVLLSLFLSIPLSFFLFSLWLCCRFSLIVAKETKTYRRSQNKCMRGPAGGSAGLGNGGHHPTTQCQCMLFPDQSKGQSLNATSFFLLFFFLAFQGKHATFSCWFFFITIIKSAMHHGTPMDKVVV